MVRRFTFAKKKKTNSEVALIIYRCKLLFYETRKCLLQNIVGTKNISTVQVNLKVAFVEKIVLIYISWI